MSFSFLMKLFLREKLVPLHFIIAALYVGFAATYQFTEKERFNATPDFFAYFTAGKLASEHLSPYNETAFKDVQYELIKERTIIKHPASVLGFLNPPHMALLFAPLAPLGYYGAFSVWLCINLLCSALLMRDALKYLGNASTNQGRFISCIAIGLLPWNVTLVQGQISIILGWALLRFFMALENKKFSQAACWTIFLSFKPHLFLLMPIPLALGGYSGVILRSVAVGIVLAVLTAYYFGESVWNEYIQFLHQLSLEGDDYGAATHFMVNLRGMVTVLAGQLPTVWYLVMDAIAATVVFYLCIHYRHADNAVKQVLIAIAVLASALCGPWLHEHDTYILFPVALLLLKTSDEPRHFNIAIAVYICMLIVTLLHPLLLWLTFTGHGGIANTLMLLKKSLIFSAQVILLYGASLILYRKGNAPLLRAPYARWR